MVHGGAVMLKTPADVREKIRAAIAGDEARTSSLAVLRRARVWVPLAVAAATAFIFFFFTYPARFARQNPVPLFEVAVASYDAIENHFEPNLPSASPADLSNAYLGHHMPHYIWNFGSSGYKLAGGRVDRLADGRQVAYTFYRGEIGSVLCVFLGAQRAELPQGEVFAPLVHMFYPYRGHSICLTKYPNDNFYCVLVTRRPLDELRRTIAVAMH